ncbi:MAG: hypothetical protein MHM6MM_000639 [Cercozoa sp. M6MM]
MLLQDEGQVAAELGANLFFGLTSSSELTLTWTDVNDTVETTLVGSNIEEQQLRVNQGVQYDTELLMHRHMVRSRVYATFEPAPQVSLASSLAVLRAPRPTRKSKHEPVTPSMPHVQSRYTAPLFDPTLFPRGIVNIGDACSLNAMLQCLVAMPDWRRILPSLAVYQSQALDAGHLASVALGVFASEYLSTVQIPYLGSNVARLQEALTEAALSADDYHMASVISQSQDTLGDPVEPLLFILRALHTGSQFTAKVWKYREIAGIENHARFEVCSQPAHPAVLSVPLLSHASTMDLLSIIARTAFAHEERQLSCDFCDRTHTAETFEGLSVLPQSLVIQLQRATQTGRSNMSLRQVPLVILSEDLAQFVVNKQEDPLAVSSVQSTAPVSHVDEYRLRAVALHRSSDHHWRALVRWSDSIVNPTTSDWYLLDDAKLPQLVPAANVALSFGSEASLLFYERVTDRRM